VNESWFLRCRIRLAEDKYARLSDELRNFDTFGWSRSAAGNAIQRPRLALRVERARARLEVLSGVVTS
jgi:hypothetical protein